MLKRTSLALVTAALLSIYSFVTHAAPGDILTSFTINNISGDGRTPTTPQGITMHDGYLWVVDMGTDRIYRVYPQDVLDTDDVTVLFSAGDSDFNIPIADTDNPPINSDGNPIGSCASAAPIGQYCGGGGLTFAENFLWNASPVTDDIIKIDPVDGDNLESENALADLAFPSPTDMTFDGTHFWIADWQTNTISKVLPEDGSILGTIPGPSSLPSYVDNPSVTNANPFGLTWDGQALWVTDTEELMIYRISATDGSLLNFFPSPGSNPKGIAWDGESIWHVDQNDQTIYRLDSGVIPFGIVGCLEKNGVAIDGDVLLSQTAIADQATTTDVDGCFQFAAFTSGVPLQVKVSESGVDEKPVITLTADTEEVTLIVGDVYDENNYLYTATDTEDGDITASVIATPDVINTPALVDTSAPNPTGITINYDVVDSAGNAADTVTRTVYILEVDTTPPVITLQGDNPLYVEQNGTFLEPGYSALDDRDGDISGSVTITGTVDATNDGTYTLDYNVVDSTGNAATTITRTVIVQDTTIPVITLVDANPLTHEKGDAFTDPGANATDNIDGPLGTVMGVGTVSDNIVGTYILTYDIADSAGNDAVTVTRSVEVVDTTAPIITIQGAATYNHELNQPYTDLGATATDHLNDDLTGSIVPTSTVNANLAGTYSVTYDVTDAAGNAATTATRTVIVSDTGAPTITLTGDNPLNHEQGTTYTEPGYSATDAIDDDTTLTGNVAIGGDVVDENTAGTYNVTYDVTDSAGNPAPQIVRTVIVADTTPPIITLLGQVNVDHELQTAYTDAGATVSDSVDLTVTTSTTDTVDINTTGIYMITYTATDASGNAAAPVTRVVDVADRTAPVITLSGANPLAHEVGTIFNDPGANATDAIDDNATLTSAIGVTGTVDANTIGAYTLNYNVSDAAGNTATTVSRTVNVVDTGAPSITLLGDDPVLHEIDTPYTDAGATASDAADGDLGTVTAVGTVDVLIAGTYTLTYDINDSQGNPAPTVSRNVIVADRTPPVISLTGSATVNHEQGTTYTDAGATATDIYDGPLGAITPTGAVNDAVAGTYILNYDISDAAGNAATTVMRTVIVSDTTAPAITLIGNNPLDHEVDTVFVDPGATASDNIDGTITNSIGVTGVVDANAQGSYTLTYNVSDSSGNAAITVVRTVNVVDTGAPTITLLGDNPVLHEQGTPYSDAGATASDAADGNLGAVAAVGAVDVNTPATYSLTYDINDSQGNPAPTVTRNVIVADRTAPVITITGSTTINHEQGATYTDAGATATDNIDPTVTVNATNTVNINIPGTYTVSYNATDAAGNSATTTVRTVIVSDTTVPVITLLGDNPVNHEVDTIFVDPGATAADNIDGPIPSGNINVTGTVNASIVGTYVLTYNVNDSSGNPAASVNRTVNVADTGAPVITITGASTINHEINTTYSDQGATASDAVDGDLTGSMVTVDSVNDTVAGTYTVTYDVNDLGGNPAAQKVRTVNVGDFTAPVITLIGSSTVNVEQGTSYTEQNATASDNVDGVISGSIVITGTVDPLVAGTYLINYNVSDVAGNPATQVTRTVVVADTTAPVITLAGAATINHEQGTAYSDPGASATDNIDGTLNGSITVSGFVDANVTGSYILSYNVSDAAGNNATTVTRTVNVADTTIPVLTLLGATPLNHEQATIYSDPGATASDNIDGDITGSVGVTNPVDSAVAATYTVTYNVSDSSGNAASTITRDVIVSDTTPPTINLNGSSSVNHEQGTTYTDAGATATDSVDGAMTVTVTGTVNDAVAGTYILNYDVTDTAGNPATTLTRTVVVEDTIAPSVALVGSSIINHVQGDVFTDPGATASDNIDGDISVDIVVTGSVDINTPGTYTLTYNVNDAAGNPAPTVTRDVIVADTVAPVITLTGSATINLEQDLAGTYTDAGATASDNVDGNISGSIAVTGDTVNVAVSGTYIIRYDVSDAAGNPATQVTRTVTVTDTTIPVITINGAPSVNHEQGIAYSDLGAAATDNIDGAITVNSSGTVDVNTAGSYVITYNASDAAGNNAVAVTRTVTVADTVGPAITLNGAATVNHEQGTTYTDAGATATDTVDGPVTPTPTSTVNDSIAGTYTVDYNAVDAIGNSAATVTRTVIVADTTIPVITLTGGSSVEHPIGQLFVDPGYAATDNIDGTITGSVNRTGILDVNTEGSYVLSYDVADAAGNNAATVQRTVTVVTPTPVSAEAETATIGGSGTVVGTTETGFDGSGYIDLGAATSSDYLEYTITANAVPYDLVINYAGTGSVTLDVILNSVSVGSITLSATGGANIWQNSSALALTPQSGTNTLRFNIPGASVTNIDDFTLTPQ